MTRYLVAGVVFFLGFAVVFAPVGILTAQLERIDGIDLVDARGTLWQGSGTAIVAGANQGAFEWRFQFSSLFRLAPAYSWSMKNGDLELSGEAAYRGTQGKLELLGTTRAELFNPWLAQFDIRLSGEFEILPTELVISISGTPELTRANGQIQWSGGIVRYIQSGVLHEANLPPLVAYVEQNAQGNVGATVFAIGDQTPLMVAEQTGRGAVKVGMTKQLTKVLRNPWPGSDPDHAVVLEFEEQLF